MDKKLIKSKLYWNRLGKQKGNKKEEVRDLQGYEQDSNVVKHVLMC